MSDYQAVTKALADGADPAMLCTTCPWDRNCVTPPSMTASEVEQQVREAAAKDEMTMRSDSSKAPMGSLLTALFLGGRDTAMQACPVLCLRLRSADGRKLADQVRSIMQGWEDS